MDYVEGNQSCKNCNHSVQAWFLVGADDIFAPFPNVYVIKQNFKLPENIKLPVETEDKFTEWLAKAEIAQGKTWCWGYHLFAFDFGTDHDRGRRQRRG